MTGDKAAGHRVAEQGVAIARELGDVQLLGEQLLGLASTASLGGGQVPHPARRALACCRRPVMSWSSPRDLNNKFSALLHAGQIEEGSAALEEASHWPKVSAATSCCTSCAATCCCSG